MASTTTPTDFFANLNTNAIVLSIPKLAAPRHHRRLGDDDLLEGRRLAQAADQMGRPAINTVFNGRPPTRTCSTTPRRQNQIRRPPAASSATNVMNGLKFFSSLDSEGAYSDAAGSALWRPS